MALFYQPDLTVPYLTPEESHHAVRVLRLRPNDVVELTDGKGGLGQAVIANTDERKTGVRITRVLQVDRPMASIHLAIAPTKNMDRMEWLVEKCTEIGVDKISFLRCKTSERPSMAVDRLRKLAISAMKQSKQAWLPEVSEIISFPDFLSHVNESQRFIAHVDESNPVHLARVAKAGGSTVLLVGPEGDFTAEELSSALEKSFIKVSLGPNRLRTETAGLFGVAVLNMINAQGSKGW